METVQKECGHRESCAESDIIEYKQISAEE